MGTHRDSTKALATLLAAWVFLLAPILSAWAWTEHPLVIRETLAALPVVRDARPVRAETIDAFLAAEQKGLEQLLAGEEAWARKNLSWYSPLPAGLEFKAGAAADVRQRFCRAVRINPDARFGLYLQLVPGQPDAGRPPLTPDKLTFLKDLSEWKATRFTELRPGEAAPPIDVVTTASDEPDFGLDIGLYEDNGTAFGKIYGFGKQPFGNPNLEYSSQGPFHMGYYHEAWIVNACAGFIRETYPEERIHLYRTLSSYAFSTGHDYWGWRFMGIGLHYLMDLNLPYHTTLLPGVSTARMLWINVLNILGFHGPQDAAIQLVSNRHTVLEAFQQAALREAYEKGDRGNPVLAVLGTVKSCPDWDDAMPRRVISANSHALAGKADRVMEETLPAQWVSDPAFELGTKPELYDVLNVMRKNGEGKAEAQATDLLTELLEPLPGYECSYIAGILGKQRVGM